MRHIGYILLAAAFLLLPVVPHARAQYGMGGAPTVREVDIQFVGPVSLSRERVMANLKTQPGTPYSDRFIEEDIRALYATGEVSNVRIVSEPTSGGVKINIILTGRPAVEEILIEGAEMISINRVRREISSKVGESLSEEKLADDRRKILELYENRNFAEVDVQYRVEPIPGTGRVRVRFIINEGPKLVVRRVTFRGNDSVLDRDLRKVMKTRPSNILSFITKAGRLLPTQVEEDRQALRTLYQNRGFADVRIGEFEVIPLGRGGVDIVVPITEGVQYHVNSVRIDGAQVAPAEELKEMLTMKEGSLYTPEGMAADLKKLREFYGRQGYVDFYALPEATLVGEGSVDLVYRVDEGVQSYVNLVNIQGNTRTKDRVIRRELAIRPGDVFDTTLVDVSRDRLNNLNYFSQVDMVPQNTIVPGRKDLNVIVQEKRTGSFNFGVGFSTIDSLVGFAELQQSNFDLFNWPRFTGGGQRFRARAQYGIKRSDFVISLTEPWFMGYQLSVGGEAYYREANFLSPVYDQSNYGFAIQARKALTNFLSARAEYRIEGVRIFNVDTDDVGSEILDAEGTYTKSAVTGELVWDTRDNLFLPRKGQLVEFTTFIAGGGLGGNVQDYGLQLRAIQYVPLPWDFIFMLKGEIATVDTWGGSDDVPLFDRLYLGGANNLRGFDFRDVGPKDEYGNPIGGNSMAYLTAEITFPIFPRLRGAFFGDVGFVNASAYDFSAVDYNADIGVGVRVDLPIGPIRVDYGYPVRSDQWNGSSGKINFNVGYQF